MPPAAAEQFCRDWLDEFLIEGEQLDVAAPPLTSEQRWKGSLDLVRRAFAEAEGANVSLEPIAHVIRDAAKAIIDVETARGDDAVERTPDLLSASMLVVLGDTELNAELVLRLVLEENAGVLAWATQQIEEFLRFTRFGEEEAKRRHRFAETMRRRALKERSGGSYLAARRRVFAKVVKPCSIPRRSPRSRPSRRTTSRRRVPARGPPRRSADSDLDHAAAGRSRHASAQVNHNSISRSNLASQSSQSGRVARSLRSGPQFAQRLSSGSASTPSHGTRRRRR